MVIAGRYYHIGSRSCTRTYGYIGNAIYQINSILFTEKENIQGKVFYIGDYCSYDIEEWGNQIANELNVKIKRVPFIMIQIAALVGDILQKIRIPFPMTNFRLKNMTTNNIVELKNLKAIAPKLPYTRIEGINETLNWMQRDAKK